MADYDDLLLQEDSSEFPLNNDESNDSLEHTDGVKAGTQPIMDSADKGARIIKGTAICNKN